MTSVATSGRSPTSIPRIKAKLVEKSHGEVQRFWTLVEQSFLPALAKGDTAAAAKSYADITAAYTAHRAVIDDIVKQTNDDNAATEAEATSRVSCSPDHSLEHLRVRLHRRRRRTGRCRQGRHPADHQDDRRHAAARRRRTGERHSFPRPQGRGRRHGRRGADLQGKCRAGSGHGSRNRRFRRGKPRKTARPRCGRWPTVSRRPIGRIVRTVSSASSDIETAAGSLTKTAETTQQLSATVAAASEQSSSNVQSAAAASEEMASSVAEIGRQVSNPRRSPRRPSSRPSEPMSEYPSCRNRRTASAKSSR